jgi:hypothetical protein
LIQLLGTLFHPIIDKIFNFQINRIKRPRVAQPGAMEMRTMNVVQGTGRRMASNEGGEHDPKTKRIVRSKADKNDKSCVLHNRESASDAGEGAHDHAGLKDHVENERAGNSLSVNAESE